MAYHLNESGADVVDPFVVVAEMAAVAVVDWKGKKKQVSEVLNSLPFEIFQFTKFEHLIFNNIILYRICSFYQSQSQT